MQGVANGGPVVSDPRQILLAGGLLEEETHVGEESGADADLAQADVALGQSEAEELAAQRKDSLLEALDRAITTLVRLRTALTQSPT